MSATKPEPQSGSLHPAGSALELARTLLACGPQRSAEPQKWTDAAFRLAPHCRGVEDVSEAAMRIFAERIAELERLVGPLGDDGTTAQARISIEHGWLCIRNDSGWLLWSSKVSDIPSDELLLGAVLEQAAGNHESWLKERECVERPNAADQRRPAEGRSAESAC